MTTDKDTFVEVDQNPDLHAMLSKLYDTDDAANRAITNFMTDLRELRIQHGIPEVIVIAAVRYASEKAMGEVAAQSLGLGDSRFHAELGVAAYRVFTAPEIERAERLKLGAAWSALPKSIEEIDNG